MKTEWVVVLNEKHPKPNTPVPSHILNMLLAHDYNSRRSSIASSQSRNIRSTVLKNMFKKIALTRSAMKKVVVVGFVSILGSFLLLQYWNDSSDSTKPSAAMSMGIYNTHIYGTLDGASGNGDNVRASAIPIK
uniref:Uncharacterized protein n=1 Tax=Anopheles culicifacies TaxID=139723 RepID=A0A182MG53_9DIPT